ncbi:hypothetical protein QR680_015063 [Steinernema hermaphroditum]|uniref:Mediator of RNA polymerase II transcription subunit 11 n=1 Tax=Steinernema hermaphroditum TaxID=289476 RepID=A0AA39IDL0_9BILA|nr:hypothetical protein QR680_015063 [Steinernema hermaphroditum]
MQSTAQGANVADEAKFRPPNAPQANEGLQKRLDALDNVDKRIGEMLDSAQYVFGELSKERQITKAKTEEAVQKFKQNLFSIESTILQQLTYLEKVCIASSHQGSAFADEERALAADGINRMLMENINGIHEKFFDHDPPKVEIKQETLDEDEIIELDDINF